MAIKIAQVRAAAANERVNTRKSDAAILSEAIRTEKTRFDVFLSHSFRDRGLVVGTKKLIEDRGLSVYVDWIDDAALDRSAVDRERADLLRTRMQQCETLFYAHTPNAALSKWCPWELGYFDASKAPDRQVFILPVEDDEAYVGQEYLSLYDTIDLTTYRHMPRSRREQSRFNQERLHDLFGLSRASPIRGPFL